MEIEVEKLRDGTYFYTVRVGGQVRYVGKAATPEEARAKVKAWATGSDDQAAA